MEKKIDNIIDSLRELVDAKDMEVSDEVILDQAIRIYLSNKISKEKKSGDDEKASEKQINLLYKLNADFNKELITKKEAKKLIEQLLKEKK